MRSVSEKMKLFFLLLLVLNSCQKNVESSYLNYDCIELENYYTQSVAPILVNNCVGCHPGYNSFEGSVATIMEGKTIERIILIFQIRDLCQKVLQNYRNKN